MRAFILFLIISNSIYAQPVPKVSPATKVVSGFSAFFDSSGTLTLQDIHQLRLDNKFSDPATVFVPGYNTFWLHFFLTNEGSTDDEFVLDFQNWSYVDVYIKEANSFRIKETGHLHPFSARDYKVANKAYILLHLKSKESKECFVRLHSDFNNELVPENLAFKVGRRKALDQEILVKSVISYSFLSILAIMFIYNFFIFLSTGLRSYALYLGVVFLGFYHTAYNSGYLVEIFWWWDSFPTLVRHFERFSSILLGVAITLFCSEFLKIKSRYPSWYKVIKGLLIGYTIAAVLILLNEKVGLISSILVGVATIATIIYLTIKSIKDKYPASLYFLFGYSAFFLSGVIMILCYTDVLRKDGWVFILAVPIGSTIEIVFYSFALANMINMLRRENLEREANQMRLIKEKEEMRLIFQREVLRTQLETQEHTFSQISAELHDNIGQLLSSTKLLLGITQRLLPESPEALVTADQTLSKALIDIRMLSKTLNKEWLNQFNLITNLELEIERINSARGVQIHFVYTFEQLPLSNESQVMLFRIIQEALQNCIKHAEATTIDIQMEVKEVIEIEIVDDGKGFKMSEDHQKGVGLINMKHRTSLMGGSIEWFSEEAKGTKICILIPPSGNR